MHIDVSRLTLCLAILGLAACQPSTMSNEHANGRAGHGHGHVQSEQGRSRISVTHFTQRAELFVEYPAFVAGAESRMLIHFTDLQDFSAVTDAIVEVRLSRAGQLIEGFRVRKPKRPGLFVAQVRSPDAGTYQMSVWLKSRKFESRHELGDVRVHSELDRHTATNEGDAVTAIEYLKEQQWNGDFSLALVQSTEIDVSVPAPASILAPGNKHAVVRASEDGVVLAGKAGFPSIGSKVSERQILLNLRPRLSVGTDNATLVLDEQKSRAAENLARENLDRLQNLFNAGAVAEFRVKEAQGELRVAQAEHRAAKARQQQLGVSSNAADVALRSPISGRIADLAVQSGDVVSAGQELLQVVGDGRMWLRADVAEVDASQLQQPSGVWMELGAEKNALRLRVGENARLLSVGGAVDPVTRTIPVLFEFEPDEAWPLRLNQRLPTRIALQAPQRMLAVPRTSIIDDNGKSVVFVQLSGESFERRPIRTGLRDDRYVAVLSGLEAGERVVDRGAYDVYLASIDPAEAGHGHAH